MNAQTILIIYLAVFSVYFVWDRLLTGLNMRHIVARRNAPPRELEAHIGVETYARSVSYNMALSRFALVSSTVSALFTLFMVLSGSLGTLEHWVQTLSLPASIRRILYIYAVSLLFSLLSLPFSIYSQFVIEARFGFNRMSPKLYLIDLVKGLLISLVLFTPLLFFLFWFMEASGSFWWVWAFFLVALFQIGITLIYPSLIAPLFNKYRPLEEGSLKDRIVALSAQEKFPIKGVFVMDGSKRSRHSNAYFTGLGKTKRIVLFDTLIEQLTEEQITAVLAHEIGHQKKRHIVIRLILSLSSMLMGLWLISLLLRYDPFFEAFGFRNPSNQAALIMFVFLSGPVTFFLQPLLSAWSRKHEYAADRYAVLAVGKSSGLEEALITLGKDNLSNLTPHPWYSFFHYSHPTLLERIAALKKA